jgi:GT2 family glycosyltransferase
VFKDAYGRDRGAVVGSKRNQFYEIDNPFYNVSSDINAFCGASVIVRKDVFERLGGFDESFFMYYEDVDLSLRMKRIGYRIMYEPKSLVSHIHAGSSGEWSSFFTYNVEKNHLATLVKHFPMSVVLREFVLYIFLWVVSFLKMLKWRFVEHWELFESWKEKTECRTKVLQWFITNLINLVRSRYFINITQKKTMKEVYKELY